MSRTPSSATHSLACAVGMLTACHASSLDPPSAAPRPLEASRSPRLLRAPSASTCQLAPRPSDAASPPPRGWNSWNHFGCSIDEHMIRESADALVASGLQAAGYDHVIIDDCWASGRDPSGAIMADAARFPSGIRALADYVHAKGLKFGIYTDAGSATCAGRPGSLGREQQDAETYAAWGVDYVKEDWCNTDGLTPAPQYRIMRDALAATGREIVLGVCDWGVGEPWAWGPATAALWRTTGDIKASWKSVLSNFDQTAALASAARPGHYNDPDMLEVGQGLSEEESRSHFSLWAMLAAPLIAGNDVRTMPSTIRDVLANREVIAVDEDPLGLQATRMRALPSGVEVFAKPLAGCGARAVLALNRSEQAATAAIDLGDLALGVGPASVRDLWAGEDLTLVSGGFSVEVAPHGVRMFVVEGDEVTPPSGESYLSDLTYAYGASAWGPIERDTSNGEAAPGDGATLSIRGSVYSKGIGVHADAAVLVYLGGRCERFTATVGVDDEVGDVPVGVRFQVWADDTLLTDSGVVTAESPPLAVSADLRGRTSLWLIVDHQGDSIDHAHADWADARLSCD